MSGVLVGGLRRVASQRLVALLVATALCVALAPAGEAFGQGEEVAEDAPEWVGPDLEDASAWTPADDPRPVPPPSRAAPIPLARSRAAEPSGATALPGPHRAEVTLRGSGQRVDVPGTPLRIAARSGGASGTKLQVEVLGPEAADRAGASGFVVRVAGEGGAALPDGGELPVEVSIDYSGFADLYGANWPDRLRLVALPACALVEPRATGCPAGVPVPARVDVEAERLVAEVDDLHALTGSEVAAQAIDLTGLVDTSGLDELGASTGEDALGAGAAPEAGSEVPAEPATEPPATTSTTEAPSSATTTTETGPPSPSPDSTTTSSTPEAAEASTTTTASNPPAATETASDDTVDAEQAPRAAAPATTEAPTTTTSGSTTTASTTTSSTVAATASTTAGAEPTTSARAAGAAGPAPEPAGPVSVAEADGGAVVLAVTSGASGPAGTFEATPLSLSGEWQVGVGSGEFSWSHPFPATPAPAGATPEVALSYSSGAVDGMVTTSNTQAPQNGVGWEDFAESFIERRYQSCSLDGWQSNVRDLCWKSDNATISLGGRASELVAVPGTSPTRWVLKDDPRWKVQRINAFISNDDNDGEHWRVTTPDGTEYWFGQTTASVYYAPVLGDDAGEPCYDTVNGATFCNQGWRWNLNKVVDRNGNTTNYNYISEVNNYLITGGWGQTIKPYERGGRLVDVTYGANGSQGWVARVAFGAQHRCASLDSSCANPGPNAVGYPDVPTDLICAATACSQTAPTFFSSKRYSSVTTYVGSTAVDTWKLSHEHKPNDEGDNKLHLRSVQRMDLADPTLMTPLLPAVEFSYTKLANRLDTGAGMTALSHFRVTGISNEFGGTVSVTYGQPNPCTAGSQSGHWDTNTKDCFPQWWVPDGGTGGFAEFHKYLTTKVEERDGTTAGQVVTTSYAYGDTSAPAGSLEAGAAWHDDNDELVPDSQQSWADWRGYGTVLVTKGQSKTRYRVFRGMHGDDLAGTGTGTKSVTIRSLDDATRTEVDEHFLAGRVFDEAQLAAGVTERGTLHDYTSVQRVNLTDPMDEPYWVGESETIERRRAPGGAYATRRTTTAYNSNQQPDTVTEHGWGDTTGDERCTRTTYVTKVVNNNQTPTAEIYMLDYPATSTLYPQAACSGTEGRRSETAYDNAAYGAAPTRGNPTHKRTKLTASPLAWSQTVTAYDAMGRPTSVTDPNGKATTTTYTPTTGYPTSTKVLNPKGHETETQWLVSRQVPDWVEDPNNRRTTYAYDKLGRLTSVRQPTEQAPNPNDPPTDPASWVFTYTVSPTKAAGPIVKTSRLQSTNPTVYLDSWVLYDGLARQRQTHRLSPVSGKAIVADTRYDANGLAWTVASPQAVSGAAGSALLPAPSGGWDNITITIVDDLLRPAIEAFQSRKPDGQYQQRTTITSYTHNTTTVDPQVGGNVRTTTDAYDRPVSVEEHDGTAWRATSYGYNLADDLLSVTDPASHTITYGYDMAGRRIGMDDPDAGYTTDPSTWGWTYAYDPAGNQTRVTDRRGTAVHTVYDPLNRPIERRKDNATTGQLLATWTYDATDELGLLDKSQRWQHSGLHAGAYTVDVVGYDARSRPTGRRTTMFSVDVPGLEGEYDVTYGYDRADHLTTVTYPTVGDPQNGGLPEETVTTTYNSLGLPVKLHGNLLPAGEDYAFAVNNAGYDDRGRPLWWGYGATDNSDTLFRTWAYDIDQRLARMQATTVGAPVMQDHQIAYDPVGNVTERNTWLAGKGWRECFGYDQRNRLTRAYTTAQAETCATGTPNGGDAGFAYNHTYTYSHDGNLTRRVEGADQTNTFDYTYPTGQTRPHAPTAIDGPSASDDWTYGWDDNGHQGTRQLGGDQDTLVWGPDRNLDKIQEANGNVKNRFVYDADGNRLVRTHVDGSTGYIEGHELNANNSGSEIKVVRTYNLAGAPVATRTAQGVEFLVTDNQNSVELAVPMGSPTPSQQRAYAPYGAKRSSDEPATDRGWIGQIEDDRTGLNYLNARYYDPTAGRFLSPDPLYDQARPQTINPYAYGLNNPSTLEDPSGLAVPVDSSSSPQVLWDARFRGGGGSQSGFVGIRSPSARAAAGIGGHVSAELLLDMLPGDLSRMAGERPRGDDFNVTYEVPGSLRNLIPGPDEITATQAERLACLGWDLIKCVGSRHIADRVQAMFGDDDGGWWNAKKHMTLSALITVAYGEDFATRFTNAHENIFEGEVLGNLGLAPAMQMDLLNNREGIRIGMQIRGELNETVAGDTPPAREEILAMQNGESVAGQIDRLTDEAVFQQNAIWIEDRR